MRLKSAAKQLVYWTGALGGLHFWRNRETLTVVMFHRVLEEADIVRSRADQQYTVTPQFFADCVAFLQSHYTLVSLNDVLLARSGKGRLPPCAALITFDDGWRDNLAVAAPLLREVPWAVFVSSDVLLGPTYWWQEVIMWALRSGMATRQQLWEHAFAKKKSGTASDDAADAYSLLMKYGGLAPEIRKRALAPFELMLRKKGIPRHMLRQNEVEVLRSSGVEIGAHGACHLPLPLLADPRSDILRAKNSLSKSAGSLSATAMSFPHGRYNLPVVNTARALGYRLLFTSDFILNQCRNGQIATDLLGRVPITTHDVGDESGRFSPSRAAAWLFLCRKSVLETGAELTH